MLSFLIVIKCPFIGAVTKFCFLGFLGWSCCRAVGAQQIPCGCSVLLIIEQRRITPGGCCAVTSVTFHRAFCPWELLLLQSIPGHGQRAVLIFYGLLQVVFQGMRYHPSNASQECEARCLFPLVLQSEVFEPFISMCSL